MRHRSIYDLRVDDEATLFSDPDDQRPASPERAPVALAADWQLDLIRSALDARGVESMQDRQSLVVQHVGREVASLRELTSEEALTVLNALGKNTPSTSATGSLWDSREGATWIDRM